MKVLGRISSHVERRVSKREFNALTAWGECKLKFDEKTWLASSTGCIVSESFRRTVWFSVG
ncbi:hypothetical protein [Baaleninema simplex]|uniref:hypothetical protein n=1 Tax=Baaleninema simplex TaxID=2862350 RepID=UPI00034B7873|nr:hypothetical protein [Baaleninema simplex]